MTPPMFLKQNIMVLDFNPQNILQFQLHIVIFAIWPLHIKVRCEWVKIKWKMVLDCEPKRTLGVTARNYRNPNMTNPCL